MSLLGDTTTYGSAWDLSSGLSVLRARASRFGATLTPASKMDRESIAAVMIGVDAWMFALAAVDLEGPARHGTHAVAALARLLTRAAGHSMTDEAPDTDVPVPDAVSSRAEAYSQWIIQVGLSVDAVLSRTASDIAFGAENQRLAEMAAALQAVAESHV